MHWESDHGPRGLSGEQKKASTPWLLPEWLASNSSVHFPLRRTVCVPGLASDHARSRHVDGGGLLPADEYHTGKTCQQDYFISRSHSNFPRPAEPVSQYTKAHICHLEWSERSCIFSYMRRKDFSPLARNDNCDTLSPRGEG